MAKNMNPKHIWMKRQPLIWMILNIFKKFVEMDDLDEKAAFDYVGVETEEKEKKELLALI